MSNFIKPRLLSGRVKKVTGERLDGSRYEYIGLAQAEPDLGQPAENGSVLLSLTTGTRYWSAALKIIDDVVRLESGIVSNSTYTGALVVTGGVGVDGRITTAEIYGDYGRYTNLSATTIYAESGQNASSTNTGALQVFGGIGVAGNIFVDGEIIAQKLTIEYTTVTTTLVVTDDIITTTNETNAEGTDTGALVVAGGAGFGKDVWIGGVLYVSGSQVVTTATIGEVFADTLQTVSDRGFTTTNQIYVANTSVSESTSTGALVVDGGVGIGQDLWVGGDIHIGKSIYLGDSLVITTSSFQENVTETLQSVTNRGNSTTNSIFIIGGFGENSNTSTFNSVLSFDNSYSDIARGPNKIKLFDDSVWQGGFGISYDSLDIYSGRNTNFYQDKTAENTGSLVLSISTSSVRIWNTTQTTATNTGALIVDGGASIGGNLWVNETIYSRGLQVVTTASLGGLGVGVIFAGTDTALDNNYGIVTIWSTATLESVTSRGSTTTHIIRIENATNSTSSDSGALTVGGGVGIAQDLWVGGDIYVGGATVVTTSSFDTNINETLQSVTNRGNTTTNIIRVANTTSSTSSDTGALTVGGGVGIGGDLHIGNQLFVEGAATFRGNVTFSGTSTFVYSTSTLYTDNFIDLHFPAGQTDSGVWTVDDGLDIGHIYHHYKADTGDEHGALIWHNESDELRWYMGGTEYVGGSQIWSFTSATFGVFRTGAIRLENTETSISTTTGALQVIGGVGIGGDLYVGGDVHVGETLSFANGGTIVDTTTTLVLTPPGALAGQGLVIRTTVGGGLSTPDTFTPGSSVTVTFTDNGSHFSTGGYVDDSESNTWTYTITGISLADLGSPLTGSFLAENWGVPGISQNQITFNIPGGSNGTGFTITLDKVITEPPYYLSGVTGLDESGRISLTVGSVTTSTEVSHVHLTSADPTTVDLYLGDDDQYVKIVKNAGGVSIKGGNSNSYGGGIIVSGGQSANSVGGTIGISGGQGQGGGGDVTISGGYATTGTGGFVGIYGGGSGDGNASWGQIVLGTGGQYEWIFGTDGKLTAPGKIAVQSTASSTSTNTGAVTVVGGVGIGGDLNVGGRVDGGGVRTTSSTTAPENPTTGDMWYDTINEVLLRYTDVGTGVFWLDLTGPVYNFGTTSTFNPNPIVLTPTYNFGTIPSSINEGSTGTFNVITSNISNGTTLYWRLNKTNSSNADFHAISGSFTITDDEGSFDVETVADSITEGEEQFTVSIKTGSETGPTVATSNSITINDTSVFIGRSLYTPGGNARDVGPFLTGTLPYAIGSNTFTWEAWIKPTSKTNNSFPGIFDLRTIGNDNSGWGLYWDVGTGSNDLNLRDGSTSRKFTSGITLNQWSHVAVTRVSGQLRAYVDGQLKAGPYTTNNNYTRTLFYIGATFDTYSMEGYITNIRLVVGNALYNGNTYTVPTKPLAAITDTVFLLTADTTATYITDTGPNNIAITNNSAGNSDVISWYDDTPFV